MCFLYNNIKHSHLLPLYRSVIPRHATGQVGGEGDTWFCYCHCRYFSNPSVLRTPPLYFAVQNTEEEFKSNPPFIADSIISFYCFCFNPLALRALPLYSLTETQGERVRCIPLSPLLRFYEPCFTMLRGTAGGEGDTWFCYCHCRYFSNPSVLRTPPLYFAVQNTEEEFKSNPPFIADLIILFYSSSFCSCAVRLNFYIEWKNRLFSATLQVRWFDYECIGRKWLFHRFFSLSCILSCRWDLTLFAVPPKLFL